MRRRCEWKGIRMIETEACPDHIRLPEEIPPEMSVSGFMGYLNGKSGTMLYERFGEGTVQIPQVRMKSGKSISRAGAGKAG